jgi:diguanylate cyclase (GGDEF)-like protein/PAS domain S-box-containing protein
LFVREALAGTRDGSFIVECVAGLADGLERLRGGGIAAVLLDLSPADGQTISALEQVWQTAPHVPILVLGSTDGESAALTDEVSRVALHHLLRERLDSYTLPRALSRIIERKAADEALFFEQQRAEVALNFIGDAMISSDTHGNVTFINPVAERMTGWSRQEALGRPLAEVFQIVDETMWEPGQNPRDQAIELDRITARTPNRLLLRRDGLETPIEEFTSSLRDRAGSVMGGVIVFKDLSEARAISLQAIHLAQHDVLTDLPSRLLLNDRLTQAMARAHRHGYRLAILFLDLDQFKHVNDSLGHVIGDTLLQSMARRLTTCVRSSDTVSRQSGDEFIVLLPEIDHGDDAAACARKIGAALLAPHVVAQHQLHVTVTTGISIYPDDGPDAETVITCAETAMYHAKESGRNNYRFFEPAMNARAIERQWIEAGLHRALARREFVLHYQPKIDLETGVMTGAEALIRWEHPERGLLFPKDFVPIAEDCGLIVPIGQWVMREACRQARAWMDKGRRPPAVAVNVSAVELKDAGFQANVRAVLDETRLDPCYLELELTESALIQHAASTALTLGAMKDLGVQVAIDDFGTGYSALSYLRQFPIKVLKIDQSFVQAISADPMDTSIVAAVISMGKTLGYRIIAEGVETGEQVAFLQAQRCGEGQGYYFSPPLIAEQFGRLLASGRAGAIFQQSAD